jgi:hypothetical protein
MKTIRIILTAATVLLGAAQFAPSGVPLMPQPARATKGQCDPAPDPYNIQSMTKGNGTVTIEARYGWDGVSVWPECAGPILRIRVTNSGTETWYAHLVGRKGTPRTITIAPGVDRTIQGGQLAQVGIETLDDLSDLTLTRIP